MRDAHHLSTLIRLYQAHGQKGLVQGAAFLHFDYQAPESDVPPERDVPINHPPVMGSQGDLTPLPKPEPSERLELPFYAITRREQWQLLQDEPELESATDNNGTAEGTQKALKPLAPRADQVPPKPPLVPWSQLGSFLRRRLSHQTLGKRLDIPQLEQRLSRLQPLTHLPRQTQSRWQPQLQLWLDVNFERLWPFCEDMWTLARQIKAARGGDGLQVWRFEDSPLKTLYPALQTRTKASRPALRPDTNLLIMSDAGIYDHSGRLLQEWLAFGRQCQQKKLRPILLLPCPPAYWPAELSRYFQLIPWQKGIHRHSSLPTARANLPRCDFRDHQAAMAKSLLSCGVTAVNLDLPLLRALRLKNHDMTSAHEAAAWQSAHVDAYPLGLAFNLDRAGEEFAHYQNDFNQLSPSQQQQLHTCVEYYHQAEPDSIRREEQLTMAVQQGEDITPLLQTFIEQEANSALLQTRQNQCTQQWLKRISYRLPVKARSGQYFEAYRRIASTLLSDIQQEKTPLPTGIMDRDLLAKGIQPQHISRYRIEQYGQQLRAQPTSEPASGFLLGEIEVLNRQLRLSVEDQPETNIMLSASGATTLLEALLPQISNSPTCFQIKSASGHWQCEALTRPHWAKAIRRTAQGIEFCYPRYDFCTGQPVIIEGEDHWEPFPSWAHNVGVDKANRLYAEIYVTEAIGQRFIYLPPGRYLMGSPESEAERFDSETQHPAVLTQGVWMADTTCTQALWQAVMGSNPSHFTDNEKRPVEQVSWEDCQEFIRTLNNHCPQLQARLPSEAEWEYACRAGTTTPFSFGETIDTAIVNYDGDYPYAGGKKGIVRAETQAVASSLPANQWGFYEMHGNVWEWCEDAFEENLGKSEQTDPVGVGGGSERVLRGGSWFDHARRCRSASRLRLRPGFRSNGIGFRLARGNPPSKPSKESAGGAGRAAPSGTRSGSVEMNSSALEWIKKRVFKR